MSEIDLTESVESLLSQVTDEFMQRLDGGEQPCIEEYTERYPRIGAILREILPALQALRSPLPVAAPAADFPTSEPVIVGCLGDYRIRREVGRGGMGVVYEAEQISLARRVALKVLPFAATLDAKHLQRFKNEAQAAAHLHHQNIVPVYAVGCERGVHYYAMQYIEGKTLSTFIDEMRQLAGLSVSGPKAPPAHESTAAAAQPGRGEAEAVNASLPIMGAPSTPAAITTPVTRHAVSTARSIQAAGHWRTVANLGLQTARALAHAHSLGVIHRDIKPANLLVDVSGNLWITDFGLAHSQTLAGLTMSGDLLGTLRYMSPEQALAQHGFIDHRTDIYSLGATLYELLTLEPIFPAGDRQEILRRIAFEEPRPLQHLNRTIPVDLETIVQKALAKSPADRYASAQELAEDLERLLKDEPIRARRLTLWQRLRKWARRHQSVVWSAGVCLLLAVGMLMASIGWIARDRTARLAATEKEAGLALVDAEALKTQAKWSEALEAVRRANGFLSNDTSSELYSRVQGLRKDLEMVLRVEQIRLPRLDAVTEGGCVADCAQEAYVLAFRDYGIDLEALEPAEAAARVRASSIRLQLTLALDNWAKTRVHLPPSERQAASAWRERLIAIAQAADPDEWRNQVRSAILHLDQEALRREVASPRIEGLPLESLSLLGWALDSMSASEQAVAVLRRAQQKYPDENGTSGHNLLSVNSLCLE
jgi:serine/threonine protein kinase